MSSLSGVSPPSSGPCAYPEAVRTRIHADGANALALLERWPEAVEAMQSAVELDPYDPSYRDMLARLAPHATGREAPADTGPTERNA